jgi:hypothetical protein
VSGQKKQSKHKGKSEKKIRFMEFACDRIGVPSRVPDDARAAGASFASRRSSAAGGRKRCGGWGAAKRGEMGFGACL